MFTNGLETTLKQAVDVIEGRNTFTRESTEFSNLAANISTTNDKILIDIEALHYMEPKSSFMVVLSNSQHEAEVRMRENGISQIGYNENVLQVPNMICNGWYIGVTHATLPNFPFGIDVIKTSNSELKLVSILHQIGKNEWKFIPTNHIPS